MEPTSEQELKQLLEEGRITEQEYQELLEAIRQKETLKEPVEKTNVSKPHTGFGKAALILMIIGLLISVVPFLLGFLFHLGVIELLVVCMIFGGPCLLLAFIFGIIGWKTKSGKIAAIGVPALGLFAFLVGFLVLPVMFVRLHKVKAQAEHRYMESYKGYSLDSMEGVLTREGVEFDEQVSSDGKGSLRIQTNSSDKTVIRLFETGPMGIENRMLIYSAKLRTERLYGKAYLEMWCDIPGLGEYFSRGLGQPVTGTTEWTNVQTPFRLEKGQMPANVKLNVVIEGTGTVWIDDIRLLLSPLN